MYKYSTQIIKLSRDDGSFIDSKTINVNNFNLRSNLFNNTIGEVEIETDKDILDYLRGSYYYFVNITKFEKLTNYNNLFSLDGHVINIQENITTLNVSSLLSSSEEHLGNFFKKPIVPLSKNDYYVDVSYAGIYATNNTNEVPVEFLKDIVQNQLDLWGNNIRLPIIIKGEGYNLPTGVSTRALMDVVGGVEKNVVNLRKWTKIRYGTLSSFITDFCKKHLLFVRFCWENHKIVMKIAPMPLLDVKKFNNDNQLIYKSIEYKNNLNSPESSRKNLSIFTNANMEFRASDGITLIDDPQHLKNYNLNANFVYNLTKEDTTKVGNDADFGIKENQKLKFVRDYLVVKAILTQTNTFNYVLLPGMALTIAYQGINDIISINEIVYGQNQIDITLGSDKYGLLRTESYKNELLKEGS